MKQRERYFYLCTEFKRWLWTRATAVTHWHQWLLFMTFRESVHSWLTSPASQATGQDGLLASGPPAAFDAEGEPRPRDESETGGQRGQAWLFSPGSQGKQNKKIFTQTGSLVFLSDWKHVEPVRLAPSLTSTNTLAYCTHTHTGFNIRRQKS